MNPTDLETLSADQLRQLLHFYADAGVEWLIEDEAIDRYAEFRVAEEARKSRAATTTRSQPAQPRSDMRDDTGGQITARQVSAVPAASVSIPDHEIAEKAVALAASVQTVADLVTAVASFTGCNLRNSARSCAFFRGNEKARFAVIGGVATADDDRQGAPFSGQAGDMVRKMVESTGLDPDEGAYFNLIPWRPPGNRPPSPFELEICRPFGLRLIELLDPEACLVMGNLPFRFLTGSREGIHAMRGSIRDIEQAGKSFRMLATFHPVDLIAAPAGKKLAWADLLAFRDLLTKSRPIRD